MSLADFFSPVGTGLLTHKVGYNQLLGSYIAKYLTEFPDIEKHNTDLAFIGVMDDRKSIENTGCAMAPDYIRKKLYQLNRGNYTPRIVDLGNIFPGSTVQDTYVALKIVLADLIQKDIVPIIIGGGQDLTYAQYLAYQQLERTVNLVSVNPHIAIQQATDNIVVAHDDSPYLNKILAHEPNYLFHYSSLAYQSYFVNQGTLRLLEQLHFDAHRLGTLHAQIQIAEPIVRNAHMLSFSTNAIRASDAPGHAKAVPNGLYGEEACQICRYAGFNDQLSSIGFYEFNPIYDDNGQTASLLAQMIWYFIDGYYNRQKDFPSTASSQYLTYKTNVKCNGHELSFIKSKKSDRWWMRVSLPNTGNNEHIHLVPCRYDDYCTAATGEVPELWWRIYHKLAAYYGRS